ncbi:MAG TPA: type I-B CRISPR-associated endonuclease Cas1b [Bacteroidales bacterium]|nr:type I-B CRISPR-associated endonuclease Cas1b [Bacteroidales bacterium]
MKKTYYLFNPGVLSRKDNTLKFTPLDDQGNEGPPRYLPVEAVDELYVFGALNANSSLYNFLGKNQISVHFFDYYENYSGSFMPRDQLLSGKLLVNQVHHHLSKSKRMVIARSIIQGGAFNMAKNLRYYQNRGKETGSFLKNIEELSAQIDTADDPETLMGIEGNIRKNYYESFDYIINDFVMDGRSKQPPLNEVNALISFGNMMCYSQCLRAIHQTQLNPTISYLHSPGERRYSLALDIAEIFKPVIIDRLIFSLLNRKELKTDDFDNKINRIILKEKGKKTFITAFETKLSETIQHRKLRKNVSYKYLIRLECYKLIKHIIGIETYKPFKMWW